MSKKRKIVFFISGIAVLIILVKVILDIPYRSQIPSLPDLSAFSDSLRNQLTSASTKAYRNPSADNLGRLGMVYHSSTNYVNAAVCYKLAVKKNKSKWIWSYYLGYLSKEMGESENAIKNFETVVKVNPKAYHAWYYIGEGYQNIGSNEKAELAFKKIASLRGNNVLQKSTSRNDYFPLRIYAKFQLSRIYLSTGKLELSEKTLQEIVQEYPTFAAAYRLLGNVYSKMGNLQLSNQNISRANDLTNYFSPIDNLIDNLSLLSKSGTYLMKQADEAEKTIYPEWAMKLLFKAVQVTPGNKYLISKAVKLFLKMGAVQQILPILNQHLSYYKDDGNELKEVAELLDENGAFSQSLSYYHQAVSLKPDDTELQSYLVMALFKAGMKEKSLDYMNELHEKDKKNIDVLSNGVFIYLNMGENEKADAYLAELNQLAPNKAKVQQLAGMIAERDGKLILATDKFEKSFKGDPTDLATVEMLGNILVKQKLWNKSIILYRKALENHPNEPYLMEKLGSLLIGCPDSKLRNIDEGMEFTQRALDHKASSPETILSAGSSLADAYAAKGDMQSASDYLKKVIQLAQNNNSSEEYLNYLGRKLKAYSK